MKKANRLTFEDFPEWVFSVSVGSSAGVECAGGLLTTLDESVSVIVAQRGAVKLRTSHTCSTQAWRMMVKLLRKQETPPETHERS